MVINEKQQVLGASGVWMDMIIMNATKSEEFTKK